MNISATHFATGRQIASPRTLPGSVPLISATTMAGVPAVVRETFGDKVLAKANREIMLDIELIQDKDCFIPQATMATFAESIARQAGDEDLGLLLAPYLEVEDYGLWGRYLLEAATLGQALERTISTLEYHSRSDHMSLSVGKSIARLTYVSAARSMVGYRHVALATIGTLLGLCQSYLGPDWRPIQIEIDLPKPRRTSNFEDVYGCPMIFNAPTMVISLSAADLGGRRLPRKPVPLITIEDLARMRREPSGSDRMLTLIVEHVWSQVLSGEVSIDSTAQAFDTGVRALQRELSREGVDFRTLVNAGRSQRAMELMRGSDASVTDIAMQLGYSTPANFARAFRTATGRSPLQYRRSAMSCNRLGDQSVAV